MSDSLLNISGKINKQTVAVFSTIKEVTDTLNIPFFVVGASARDIVLHHCYGARIERATEDIDLGIQIPDWNSFDAIKSALRQKGFEPTKSTQKLIRADGMEIDIVLFGQVANEHKNIAWPPEGDTVMTVLGFKEAYDHSAIVIIQEEPIVEIPVAVPKGIALLKLIAWLERPLNIRPKDARDLCYLMNNYHRIPHVENLLFANGIMEIYDWEIPLAGSHQLGIDAKNIATSQTLKVIMNLFDGHHKKHNTEKLIEEMGSRMGEDFERNEQLLNAFVDGFRK